MLLVEGVSACILPYYLSPKKWTLAINSVVPIEFENVHPLVNQHQKKKREKIQQNISSGHSEWPLKNQKTTKKTSFLAKEIKDVDPILMRRKSAFWHSFGETAGFFTPMIHSFSRFEHPKKKRLPFSSGQKQTHPMHYREIL